LYWFPSGLCSADEARPPNQHGFHLITVRCSSTARAGGSAILRE
jgi:hypothetical protein